MSADSALQVAQFKALEEAGVPVYDAIPRTDDGAPEPSPPYVVIGQSFTQEDGTKTTDIEDVRSRIRIISAARGWHEAKQLKAEVIDTLHRTRFDLEGFHVSRARFLQSNPTTFEERGATWRQLAVDFDYRIQWLDTSDSDESNNEE